MRSISDWINESIHSTGGDLRPTTLHDMLFPSHARARVAAEAAEWLTYYLAVGEDGGQSLADVLGNGLARGIDGRTMAKLVEMMDLQVEQRDGVPFLVLPAEHPYRIDYDDEEDVDAGI